MYSYKSEQDDKHKILIFRVYGSVNSAAGKLLSQISREQAFLLKYKLIIDYREADINSTIADAYTFVREKYRMIAPHLRSIKSAIITDPYKDSDFWKFFETTSKNTGVNVSLFYDIKDAMKWLEKS